MPPPTLRLDHRSLAALFAGLASHLYATLGPGRRRLRHGGLLHAGAGSVSVLDAGGTIDRRPVLKPGIIAALFGLAALSLPAMPRKARLNRSPT